MPERLDKLRDTLTELEAELEKAGEIDAATRERLEHARSEIQAKLDADMPPEEWQTTSFMDSLLETEQEFAASHPTTAGVVRRIIDLLGQMGI